LLVLAEKLLDKKALESVRKKVNVKSRLKKYLTSSNGEKHIEVFIKSTYEKEYENLKVKNVELFGDQK